MYKMKKCRYDEHNRYEPVPLRSKHSLKGPDPAPPHQSRRDASAGVVLCVCKITFRKSSPACGKKQTLSCRLNPQFQPPLFEKGYAELSPLKNIFLD